ncbi:MAG TPA: hypothetical protein VNE39_26885 [Planctomycetota bacterium]|nr:hypothetical protein [Planctomycetota bacterium]
MKAVCSAWLAASLFVAAQAGEPAQEAGNVLAWLRVEKSIEAGEELDGVPYIWLGRADISLTIDVPPQPGHVLELSWGSKNDTREGVATINGQQVKLRAGGYTGFKPLLVPIPDKVAGQRYEITLAHAGEKAGFISGVRLLGKDKVAAEPPPDPKAPAHKVALKLAVRALPTGPPQGEAFPEMQKVWDTAHPAPTTPLPDAKQEAAFRLAEKNGRLANEMLYRCRKFVEGWLAQADPKTGLIPRNLGGSRDQWVIKDSAADNYPFMVLTSALTDRALFEGRMLDMLRTEAKLTSRLDRLADDWSFSKQAFVRDAPNLQAIIFGSSEYVKDGLIPLTEWLGPSPWCDRMIGLLDDLFKHAEVKTPFGDITTTNVEVNGDQLQALSRVFWMTGDRKYLEWAIRIGDYYLLGDNHPTRNFASLRLRDHGCEVVCGLSELYLAVAHAMPEKKKAYEKPIHEMLDRILEVGRDPRGMLYNAINPKAGTHDKGICDTWGYNYNGVYTVWLLDKTEAYRDAIRHVLKHLPEMTSYHWGSADEYADSIEGAINLYNREPVPEATEWIDSEIHDMWRVQKPDGIVEGWHGDGNSARTAIMYALWKTQGITVQPWREDVRLGAVLLADSESRVTRHASGRLCISLVAAKPWEGKLVFDKPRHKLNMHMPMDYPRINQFPEWFVAEADRRYTIRNLATGKESARAGKELQDGIPVVLEPGVELRLAAGIQSE